MFITAAEAVAEQVTDEDFENGLIYPRVKDIKSVSFNVAVKVAEQVFASGLAGIERPGDLRSYIRRKIYVLHY